MPEPMSEERLAEIEATSLREIQDAIAAGVADPRTGLPYGLAQGLSGPPPDVEFRCAVAHGRAWPGRG